MPRLNDQRNLRWQDTRPSGFSDRCCATGLRAVCLQDAAARLGALPLSYVVDPEGQGVAHRPPRASPDLLECPAAWLYVGNTASTSSTTPSQIRIRIWCRRRDSNPGPSVQKSVPTSA